MEKVVFVVRKAVEEDIPQIHQITMEAFSAYVESAEINGTIAALQESYDDIRHDINNKEVFVAAVGDSIVGCVRIEIKPDNTAYLSRFGVSVAYQNNGIGKLLMNEVDKLMQKSGVTNLYLHTASRVLSLVRFYYGRGFYIESTTKDRGYIRALLCKEYKPIKNENTAGNFYGNSAAV